MKYKSFWAQIDITDIEFLPGKVIFLKDLKGIYGETNGAKQLSFNQSLKNEKAVEVKTFPLKDLLEGK